MQIILVLIAVVAIVGGGYYVSSRDSESGMAADAKKQADQFTNSLYSQGGAGTRAPAMPASGAGATASQGTMPDITSNSKIMTATLHTSIGNITIEFMDTDAPHTVANFVTLAKDGFYNRTKFHRVIDGFMIQGGDPLTKDDSMEARWGTGDPGYKFADEIHKNNKNNVGTISMANSGPNTNGSQFFVNVANNNFLDGKHTVFGRVTAGMDVVEKIAKTKTGAQDRPTTPVVINSVTVQ